MNVIDLEDRRLEQIVDVQFPNPDEAKSSAGQLLHSTQWRQTVDLQNCPLHRQKPDLVKVEPELSLRR
jgi:hypothetical protein